MEGELVGGKVTLRQLNEKAITKLHDLIASLDARSEPDLIRSCIESLAKLDSALKGSDILEKEKSPEERALEEKRGVAEALLRK